MEQNILRLSFGLNLIKIVPLNYSEIGYDNWAIFENSVNENFMVTFEKNIILELQGKVGQR